MYYHHSTSPAGGCQAGRRFIATAAGALAYLGVQHEGDSHAVARH